MNRLEKKSADCRRRHNRLRQKVKGTTERPRLAVFRSLRNIYAQIIDDLSGKTLIQVSTLDKEYEDGKTGGNADAATWVGKTLAARAKDQKIESVVFDRGGRKYHGRVKALAEAAREGGLKF